jgi:cation diffusion facilitator CzcD-associated flavoprotein CzcO
LSHLPGRRFPRGTPVFSSRDQLVEHVERHANGDEIDLQLGARVDRPERADGAWIAHAATGKIRAPQAVVATGYEQLPVIPDWDGREVFRGQLLHASEYRNAAPFIGKSVVVVGPGCSGMEIAYDLAEGRAAKVWLSARTPPNIILREGVHARAVRQLNRALVEATP